MIMYTSLVFSVALTSGIPTDWSRRLTDLLGEVIRLPNLFDELELRLQPVHVVLRIHQDSRQELLASVVANVAAKLDALVELRDRLRLEGGVVSEDLDHGLPDRKLAQLLQIGQAIEKEDALHELVGVLHLVDRLLVNLLAEVLVTPVQAHLGVEEVLTDGGQLAGQDFVE